MHCARLRLAFGAARTCSGSVARLTNQWHWCMIPDLHILLNTTILGTNWVGCNFRELLEWVRTIGRYSWGIIGNMRPFFYLANRYLHFYNTIRQLGYPCPCCPSLKGLSHCSNLRENWFLAFFDNFLIRLVNNDGLNTWIRKFVTT